jgi:hypothetical protein
VGKYLFKRFAFGFPLPRAQGLATALGGPQLLYNQQKHILVKEFVFC